MFPQRPDSLETRARMMGDQPVAMQNLSLEDFPFQSYDKVRYADTDRQGHVNNAAFSTFLETGRVEFLYAPQNPLAAGDASFVIASLELTFSAEVNWPGRVEIGTGVVKVGNSSIRLMQGLFQDGRCVATAETVIVQMDERSRKSRPLSDEARAFLAQYLPPSAIRHGALLLGAHGGADDHDERRDHAQHVGDEHGGEQGRERDKHGHFLLSQRARHRPVGPWDTTGRWRITGS